ncbi:hypothetical protein PEC730217_15870 [Pectobacterium carotovorum subsp. carotovorum]|uniref:hypothetical protein n=2 Tax=Pectobacterium versatile TaxID=2488639 RepID=UPI00208AF236|nr:hypothetical protein PEC730217_15870 [Pectobacterium carotovorum subsp. carotovorum]
MIMITNDEPKYVSDYVDEIKKILETHSLDIPHYKKIASNLKKETPEGLRAVFDYANRNGPSGENHIADSLQGLHCAFLALTAVGCDEWAIRVAKIIPIISVMNDGAKAYANMKIREEKSKGGKGKTSRHKESALKIAADTWATYPNASIPGMRDELYAHFRAKWNDCPSSSTIQDWLKVSGLNPLNDGVKNRMFSLIFCE